MAPTPQNPRISIDPAVCHGKPVITGTRVPVEVLLSAIAGGDEIAQVAADYGVSAEDVRAAVSHAGFDMGRLRSHRVQERTGQV